jgi:hypothetical protein
MSSAVEAHEVERHERGPRRAALGQERVEVAARVVAEHDRLAIDQRLVRREAANRVGDPLKRFRESALRRLQTRTRSPWFRARMRKPSSLISCSRFAKLAKESWPRAVGGSGAY